jgi:hypothetical protein
MKNETGRIDRNQHHNVSSMRGTYVRSTQSRPAGIFSWLCTRNNIPEANYAVAATGMREHVRKIRRLYRNPIGFRLPYDDAFFRAACLLTYFTYYIEPVYHVLREARFPGS